MIRDERFARILSYVNEKQYASVDELVQLLGVSKATVRRDLSMLCSTEQLVSSWGGVRAQVTTEKSEPVYNEKKISHVAEKRRIGEAAAKLIRPGMSVILDAGTTTQAIVPYIKGIRNLNIATNDLMIAVDLAVLENINVMVTGGQIRSNYYTLRGFSAEDMVKNIRADIAFLGFDMIDVNAGFFITNTDEVALKRCMIESAKKVVAVCDHTKFHGNAFVSVCPVERVNVVISDRNAPVDAVKQLVKAQVEVVLA